MDKKELQNLIDRISLTGPEGIKKIKKVLKELNNGSGGSSSGSMGEDEEYTIAQALNDLNERIGGLQAQIAQQDYLRIPVNGFNADDVRAALPQEKATEYAKRNVLLDVVFVFQEEGTDVFAEARLVSYTVNKESGNVISFNYVDEIVLLVEY